MFDPPTDADEFTIKGEPEPTDALEGIALPHSSSTWKVLGAINAPAGTGVLGHNTATTGPATGVEGVTDAVADSATGVRGRVTASTGETYGVEGTTRSSNGLAAGVRAGAPNGAKGLIADADSGTAVFGDSTDGMGVWGRSDTDIGGRFQTASGSIGLFAWNRSATGTNKYGIEGLTDSPGPESAGLYGQARASSGQTYGVFGETMSVDDAAAGVFGTTSSSVGSAVLGTNTASTGTGEGVKGVVDSADDAAGVLGEAPHGGSDGVIGIANNGGIGVGGLTDSPNQAGVRAINAATAGAAIGLEATTGSSDAGALGVLGHATAGSGPTYGVQGRTDSTAAAAAGVHGRATNTSGTAAAIKATGHVEITDVGASAYLNEVQATSTSVHTVVGFDTEVADHFDDFDTSDGTFTASIRGDYHVSTAVGTTTSVGNGTHMIIGIFRNGTRLAKNFRVANADTTSPNIHLSKTLYGVSATDVIDVRFFQDSGGTIDLATGRDETYVTIDKVG